MSTLWSEEVSELPSDLWVMHPHICPPVCNGVTRKLTFSVLELYGRLVSFPNSQSVIWIKNFVESSLCTLLRDSEVVDRCGNLGQLAKICDRRNSAASKFFV